MQNKMNEISALFEKGAFGDALKLCDELVAAHPKNDKIRYAQAMLRQKSGDSEGAVESYRETVRIAPKHQMALTNLGGLLFILKRMEEAIEPLQKAVDLNPKNYPALSNLAHSLYGTDRFEEALIQAERAKELNEDAIDIQVLLVQINDKLDRFEDTVIAAKKMVELKPERKDGWMILAANLQSLGRFDEAADLMREGLKRAPDDPGAHVLLSKGKRSQAEERHSLRVLSANVKSGRMPKLEEIDARFSMGDLYDRAGEYDKAFAAYHAANTMKQEFEPYDRKRFDQFLDDLKTVYTPEFFAERSGWGHPSARPIFVVGMPRSGTTLTEQILARHPDVEGFGERGLFERVSNPDFEPGYFHDNYIEVIEGLTEADVRSHSETYMAKPSELVPVPPHPLDKTPANIHSLGLIALAFPQAKLLFCRRDPIDVCLSNYQQNFKIGNISSSTSLENLVHAYDMCWDALVHFQTVLPMPIEIVDYEHLVSEPDKAANYLYDLAGLEHSGEKVDHTAGSRGVRTASIWQVRQPIYKTSVQKWRRYEKHLGVLIEGLSKYMSEEKGSASAAE